MTLIEDGKMITEDLKIAETVNHYFINITKSFVNHYFININITKSAKICL